MMPKPKSSNNRVAYNNHGNNPTISERTLYESKPNMLMYSDNFIFKIIVLFIIVFLFKPILAVVSSIQVGLMTSFQLEFTRMTFIAELLLILAIIIILIKLALDLLDWNYTTYKLTDKRVIIERGFLNKDKISMPYTKIQDMDIQQSILERVFGVGDIIIYGGHENTETILDDVPDPKKVEEIILSHVNNYSNGYPATENNYNPNYNTYTNGGGYNAGRDDRIYEQNNNRATYNPKPNKNIGQHYYEDTSEDTSSDDDYGFTKKKTFNRTKQVPDEDLLLKHDRMFKKHNKK